MHISLRLLPTAMPPFRIPTEAQIAVLLSRRARRHPEEQKFRGRVTNVGGRRYDAMRKTKREPRRALTAREVDSIALSADSH